MTLLKINRLLPIYISIVPLKFEVDIQSPSKVRVWEPKNPIWLPGGHFESDCLWPPSTCIWNLKVKFQSKLDLCSGNHVVYRQTDRRTDKVGRGYNNDTRWPVHSYHKTQWSVKPMFISREVFTPPDDLNKKLSRGCLGRLSSIPNRQLSSLEERTLPQGPISVSRQPEKCPTSWIIRSPFPHLLHKNSNNAQHDNCKPISYYTR